MRIQSVLIIAALALFTALPAHAGILLEPYLGYGTGSIDTTPKADVTGLMYGARVGFTMPVLFVAADYSLGTMKAKQAGVSTNGDQTMFGIDVGASIPMVPVRAWVGYDFTNQNKSSTTKLEGNAIKLGAGFSGLPFISLNVEYIMGKYTKANGVDLTTDLKSNVVFLSVSAPFDF
jgi:hypothetical protein